MSSSVPVAVAPQFEILCHVDKNYRWASVTDFVCFVLHQKDRNVARRTLSNLSWPVWEHCFRIKVPQRHNARILITSPHVLQAIALSLPVDGMTTEWRIHCCRVIADLLKCQEFLPLCIELAKYKPIDINPLLAMPLPKTPDSKKKVEEIDSLGILAAVADVELAPLRTKKRKIEADIKQLLTTQNKMEQDVRNWLNLVNVCEQKYKVVKGRLEQQIQIDIAKAKTLSTTIQNFVEEVEFMKCAKDLVSPF